MPTSQPQTPTRVKKRTFPLTPSPPPTKPRPVKHQRRSAPALTVETPRIFIGRPCCPPFVHRSDIITRINITWLKTGEIDELEYDDEISATREWHAVGLPEADVPIDLTHLDEDEESTNMSEARPVRGERADRGPRCVADETWSFAQHNAIWLAQVGIANLPC